MATKLSTPQIIRFRDTVTLRGVTYKLPTTEQITQANRLTRRQFELYSEFAKITSKTEQGEGRKARITRMIPALEKSKHRLLQMDVLHLLPDHLRKLVSEPMG